VFRQAAYWGLLRGWRTVRWGLMPALGHEVMKHRSPVQMVSQWPEGEIPLGPKVCVFVHWDGAGEVRDHVMHQVRSLAGVGFSVVFVTNSGSLRPAALEALKLVCAGVIVRRNVGYDFGAWREGIERLALPRANTTMVAIANDSVYGPIRSLHELFAAIDFDVADVWGATDTWQSRYHLQSYLMVFSPAVVASEAWRRFWAGVRPTWAKVWLIRLYEIGLTQALLKAGFRCRAIWPYESLIKDVDLSLIDDRAMELARKRAEAAEEAAWEAARSGEPVRPVGDGGIPNLSDPIVQARRRHVLRLREAIAARVPLNPTSDLWRQLLQARFPFIKRELLRENPSRVPDVVEWKAVASEISDRSLAPIEKDLQRALRNRAP
jgi:hypothetical protein